MRLSSRRGLWIAILILAAAIPYLPSLRYGFVYDDALIVDNPNLSSPRHIPEFFTQSLDKKVGFHNQNVPVFYRPLFLTQLCLTRVLFGPGPFGFHLFSVLLHPLNTLLLYGLTIEFGLSETTALFTAMLFAVHPVHVESVVWPSASPEPMALAAILVSLIAFRRFSASGKGGMWLALSIVALLAGLFVKETAIIVLPVVGVLAFLDPASAMTHSKRAIVVSFFAVATVLYLILRGSVLHALTTTITPTSWADMCRTWPNVLWFYARHLVLPIQPSVLYDYDIVQHATVADFWLPLAGVLASAIAIGYVAWKHRSPAALVAVFLLVLPVVLVLNFRVFYWGDLVHDRYLYTPSAGFCLLTAMGIADLGERLGEKVTRPVRWTVAAGLAGMLALVTVVQSQPWRNNLLLMTNAVKIAPRNIAAQMMLGNELESDGYFAAASTCYGRALLITPRWGPVWFSFGRTLLLTNDTPNAIRSLEQAVKLDEQPISLVWLSMALNRAGQSQRAEALLERAEAEDATMRVKFTALEQTLPAGK